MNQPPLNPDARRGYISDGAGLNAACTAYVAPGFGIPAPARMDIAIQAYLAAALPEVTSVEELEALPEGTILRDSYGLALHKRTANWWVTNCESNLTSEDLADEIADTAHTYTVLYRPEVKP